MRKKKILVIDDDEMNLQIAKMILERKLPCEVICAASGFDGLEILRNERVNLVLLDILMPEMDGMETLLKIRADERIKKVSVMMLTATVEKDLIQRAMALGVTDYIKKPFLPADLIKRVEKKFAEIHSEEILLIGDDESELRGMKELIEENFDHEALTATTFAEATKILREREPTLIIACADMKFINGFKILEFVGSDEKFSAIPFALTTVDKLLEVIDKINAPQVEETTSAVEKITEPSAPTIENPTVEEKISETLPAEEKIPDEPPISEKVNSSPVIHSEKKRIANVVTNLIGYELDLHI